MPNIPESCQTCNARAACVFVDLRDPARRAFEEITRAKAYSARATVVRQGDPVEGVFVVQSGLVRLTHLTPWGRNVAVQLVGPAAVLGLPEMISGGSFPWNAEVVQRTVLELIPRDEMLSFLSAYPEVTLDLLTQVSRELVKIQADLCASMSGSPLRERLLGKLCELCGDWGVKTPQGLELDLRITVQDLADHLGCSRQWVSKALGELEDDGLVRRRSRGALLLTPAALARDGERGSPGAPTTA
jgi:CRP/FNR family transcriptional regulator